MRKLFLMLIVAIVAMATPISCVVYEPADCTEQEARIDELEARPPCPECPEAEICPECEAYPECEECLETVSPEVFANVLELKRWLEEDTTDQAYSGDMNLLAIALQESAMSDGYLINVHPFKKGCPGPKHHLSNFVIIRNYCYTINAKTDEVNRYIGLEIGD